MRALTVDLAIAGPLRTTLLPPLVAMKNRANAFFSCLLAVVTTVASTALAADAKPTFTLRSQRKPGQTDRVGVLLEVGGETTYLDDGKPKREKMSVVCRLEYDEKTLETPADADGAWVDGVWRSVRDYQKAAAVVKVGEGEFKPEIRPQRRLIGAQFAEQTLTLFSPAGPLARDELDAINVPADSLLLDGLLPKKPVAVGDHWRHSKKLLCAMLGLDEVAESDVESTLKEVTNVVARFELSGGVQGAIHGVSTKIELKGKYRFDRRSKRIDWLGMLLKEERESSFVDDGVNAVSRLQITIKPVPEPESLSGPTLAKVTLTPTEALTRLAYESADGWRCGFDRRWYRHDLAVFQLIDRGEMLAQCNISSLPRRDPEKLVSLEELQADVRQALGESFGSFIEASQQVDPAEHRVLRVVAHGKSSDLPIRWVYYHVADQQGRQAALTFTIEQKLVERFADADKPIVASLRFVDPKAKKETNAGSAGKKSL